MRSVTDMAMHRGEIPREQGAQGQDSRRLKQRAAGARGSLKGCGKDALRRNTLDVQGEDSRTRWRGRGS